MLNCRTDSALRQSLLPHWWQALQRRALSGLLRTESGSSNATWQQQSRR
jgi:hypothetical protein